MDHSPSTETESVSLHLAKKYWAFISYSSKDAKWGKWLHSRLENYPIPKEFQGTELFDGAVLGKDLKPCFRDRDELSGSADLGPAILKALNQSRYLIVLCSKNSAKSEWVNKEIEDFKSIGGEKKILALILDGEPNASSNPNLPDNEECFPPALRYPVEPLAGDMRKEGDGKERGFLKVLSGIAQLDFDVLYRRHERAQRKKRLVLGGIAASIMLSLTGLSIYAFQQRNFALGEQKRAEAARVKAEASELREREAKEQSLALLKTVRSSLNFMNFQLRDVMEKYVPTHERTAVIDQVDSLLKSLKDIPGDSTENGEPDVDDLRQRMVSLINKGDLILASSTHDPSEAVSIYNEALQIAEKLVISDPENAEFQRDLSVTHAKLGVLSLRLGDTAQALAHERECMRLCEKLLALNPSSDLYRSDLPASHVKLGDLFLRLGDTDQAHSHYEDSVELREKLVSDAPENAEFQRDMYISYTKLGEVCLQLGETAKTLIYYEKAIEISKKLSELDPDNRETQLDLSVTHSKLGDLCLVLGETSQALTHFEQNVKVMERLVELDPNNTDFKRHLSVSKSKLGDLLLNLDKTSEAYGHYQESLELRRKLVVLDPDNAVLQRDLANSYERLGSFCRRVGDSSAALANFEESMKLRLKMASVDPDNTALLHTLSISHSKLGDVRFDLGELEAALTQYEEAMRIAKKLADHDKENVAFQRGLAISHDMLGNVRLQLGEPTKALAHYVGSQALKEKLVALDPDNAEFQRDLFVIRYRNSRVYIHEDISEYLKAKTELEAALAILEGMKKKGILAPSDEKHIPFLKSEIEKVAAME
ncbi:MAG: TIR domain-containing protein [Luteolibacter sp.]